MKKTAVFALTLALFAAGCGPQFQYVHLRKSPTSLVMVNVRSDGTRSVAYTFESKLADAFEFKGIIIDLNASYKSNLQHYMDHKYQIEGGSGNKIAVSVESCDIETADAGTQTVSVGLGTMTIQSLTVTTTLKVKVRVEAGGKVTEDEIVTVGEYTGEINSLSTGQASISMALEGSILLVDRFLDKAFGVSRPSVEPEGENVNTTSDI